MKIVKLKDVRFGAKPISRVISGYALYEEGEGYYAFTNMRDSFGILIPYMPNGGKKALQSIIDAGGFISTEGMEFVNSI